MRRKDKEKEKEEGHVQRLDTCKHASIPGTVSSNQEPYYTYH